jgi:DNA-binding NarL/FixJ family response regulator
MEQLKQVLQLKKDGISIREIARRTGISRNSVRKYLASLSVDNPSETGEFSNKQLADKAYKNDLLQASVFTARAPPFAFSGCPYRAV